MSVTVQTKYPAMFRVRQAFDPVQVDDIPAEVDRQLSGLNLGDGSGTSPEALQRRYRAFDFLVERSLLSQAAAEAGFEISDELVEENIKKGIAYVMGQRVTGVVQVVT